jgi:hypothetical protein
MSRPPKAMAQAVTTRWTEAAETWSSRWIDDRATFTMLKPRATM